MIWGAQGQHTLVPQPIGARHSDLFAEERCEQHMLICCHGKLSAYYTKGNHVQALNFQGSKFLNSIHSQWPSFEAEQHPS